MTRLEELKKKAQELYSEYNTVMDEIEKHIREAKPHMFCFKGGSYHPFINLLDGCITDDVIIESETNEECTWYECSVFTKGILKMFEILQSNGASSISNVIYPSNCIPDENDIDYIWIHWKDIKDDNLTSLINSNDASNIALAVSLHKSQTP